MIKRFVLVCAVLLAGAAVPRWLRAEEFPIKLGTGSDTVFLQTGVDPDQDKRNSLHPDLNAMLSYDADMRVREITLGISFFADLPPSPNGHPAPKPPVYSLDGISLGDTRASVIAKVGQPTREVPKSDLAAQLPEVDTFLWKTSDKLLLVISFYLKDSSDEPKSVKDTVASITLRKGNF